MKNSTYAAIDIGSYNCRLTIFKRKNGGFKVIHNFSYSTNLIKNLSFNNEFTDQNISKTIKCLESFSKKLKKYNVDVYRCIATEACRQVINSDFFVEKARNKTGINVEVISTQEEAELSLRSCEKYLKKIKNHGVIFDIGGGSTEFTFFDFNKKIFNSRSISYGVINLSEKKDLFNEKIIDKQLYDHFYLFKNDLSEVLNSDFVSIGSCNTVTTLCAIHQNLKYFDLKKIEGYEMNKEDLLNVISFVNKISNSELRRLPCVGSRYTLLLNGIIILKFILKIFPINKVIVTQVGLREGIFKNLLERYEKN